MKYRNIFITDSTACDLAHNNGNLISELLVNKGYNIVEEFSQADLILFFGCVYVSRRIQECIEEIDKIIAGKKEDAIVIITGCFSRKKEIINLYKGKVDYIISEYGVNGIAETMKLIDTLNSEICELNISNMIASSDDPYYSINITDGCNNRCTFCKNNYMNTQIRSRPIETIIKNAKEKITSCGIRCITLNGLNTTQYGIDLVGKKILHKLIQRLSEIEELLWIRVYMLAPQDMYQELIDEIKSNKKVVSLVVPIQTCSNKLLIDMNRQHSDEECLDMISQIRNARPDIFILSELMSCFPTETYKDIIVTSERIRKYRFNGMIISTYSNNSELPSSKMIQLSDEERHIHQVLYQRLIMREFSRKQDSLKGKTIPCIVVEKIDNTYVGITNFILETENLYVLLDVPKDKDISKGTLIKAKITALPPKCKQYDFQPRLDNVIKAKFVEED